MGSIFNFSSTSVFIVIELETLDHLSLFPIFIDLTLNTLKKSAVRQNKHVPIFCRHEENIGLRRYDRVIRILKLITRQPAFNPFICQTKK